MIIIEALIGILILRCLWSAMFRHAEPKESRPNGRRGTRAMSQNTTRAAQGKAEEKAECWRRLPPRICLGDTVGEHPVAPVPGSILSAPDHNHEFFMRHIGF
jgi:hypothetical protein